MKNNILKKAILTAAISSMVAVPIFAQDINDSTTDKSFEILPINYVFNHWAEVYLDNLTSKFDVKEIFAGKNLESNILVEDFIKSVKLTIDGDYVNIPEEVTRESIVYELAKIWAEKTGKDLDKIPTIKMLIYSDTSDIDMKYLQGVYVAYMKDIAKGKDTAIFDPKTNVTYGELAVLINNTINAIEKELEITQPIAKGKYETKGNYEVQDDKMIFNFELISHFTEAQEIMLGSGQKFELTITNEEGEEVYRFSDGKFFTMALLYKTLEPGESLKWQDEWDMTNKEGEKLTDGNYKAKIEILVITEEGEKIEEEQLTTIIDFSLDNNNIIPSDVAIEGMAKTADELMNSIKSKDSDAIADYVHPVKGVRFTPYTTVSTEDDLVINKEDMKSFFNDDNLYVWGHYDGRGDEIKLTPSAYYEKFIYSEDFVNAPQIGYNEVLRFGNMIENQFEVYENAIVVEYYIPEINPEYGGLDWQSLRLAFEEYEGTWKLVGIIHNQWTI